MERLNSKSLIERTIECLSPLAQSVLVVISQEQIGIIDAPKFKVKVVVDLYPGKGALGGIYTGLANADNIYSLVVGGDMPFLNRDLLSYIIDNTSNFDAVVPRVGGMLEPLHAVYSKSCLEPIRNMIEQDRLGISPLFNLVKTKYIGEEEIVKFDPCFLSFFNINTRADLKKAKQLIKREEHYLMGVKDDFNCD